MSIGGTLERIAVVALMHEWAEEFAAEAVHARVKVIATRLLQDRFGALPAELRSTINQLSVDTLDELATATLHFKDLAEAQAWVAQHGQSSSNVT